MSLIGINHFTKKLNYKKRLLIGLGYFIIYFSFLVLIDFVSVTVHSQVPRFSYEKMYIDNIAIYKAPFYNVYRVNIDTKNEYYIIDTKKEYTIDTLPVVPFNRNKAGIDNLSKFKNQYLGNNSNTGNIISNLPLAEYGYTFEIDSENLGLTINYHITDWYINENYYLEKSLVYNSVSLFSLIGNLDHITYNFSGKTYSVDKDGIKNYPHYEDIIKSNKNFNKYLEAKINNDEFIDQVFKKLFN